MSPTQATANPHPGVLSHESPADFLNLSQRLRADLQPDGEHESFLANQMIQSRWRIERIDRLETAAFEQILGTETPDSSPDPGIAAHLSLKGKDALSVLQKYRAAAESTYHKCHRELLNGRQVALKMQSKATDNYIKNVIFAPLPSQAAANGFASQKAESNAHLCQDVTPPPSPCAAFSKT